MIELTDDARKHLDDYLRKTRSYLQGCKSVDAADIEQNINEHIENELADKPAPVSCDELDKILERLGSPRQWVPEDELSEWRKLVLRLRTGPEDWRLAYVSFALFVLAFLTRLGFFVLLPASFLLARAAVSAAENRDELGGQKWLIYPSLIAVYAAVICLLLFWPAFAAGIADGLEHKLVGPDATFQDKRPFWLFACLIIGSITGIWWMILSVLTRVFRESAKQVFYPFAGFLNPRSVRLLMLSGLALFVISLTSAALLIA